MATNEEVRRDNLLFLIEQAGSQRALAERIGKAPAQISQWVTGAPDARGNPRTMGRATARHIEERLGLPTGWMDQAHGGAADAGQSQAARYDDATMAQAFELLYLIADHRPDDPRFARLSWPMVLVAAKAIARAEAAENQRAVIAEILAEI